MELNNQEEYFMDKVAEAKSKLSVFLYAARDLCERFEFESDSERLSLAVLIRNEVSHMIHKDEIEEDRKRLKEERERMHRQTQEEMRRRLDE